MKFFCAHTLFFLLLLTQCGSPQEQVPQGAASSIEKDALQSMNKYLSEKEQDMLASYVARQQLDMRQAPSGYYYQVVAQGSGAAAAEGCAVRLYGRVMLIDGALCYAYTEQNPLELRVGAHTGIKILNVALLGMKAESKVRFVFPAHMAYGLLGDGNKIPPYSPLVCEFVIAKVAKE